MTDDTVDITEQAEKLVTGAKDNSVTSSKLTNGKGDWIPKSFLNEPLITYLSDDEQPHYILTSTFSDIIIGEKDGGETHLNPDPTALITVTDKRVLITVQEDQEDDILSVPLELINEANYSSSLLSKKLYINTSRYTYEIENPGDADIPEVISFIEDTDTTFEDGGEIHYIVEDNTKIICKRCKEKVDSEAESCPHCGFSPKDRKKGALWHGTALATSFSPIGWAMMAKGAADEARSRESITEVVDDNNGQDPSSTDGVYDDPLDKLDRLSKLHDQGAISDEEFEEKKAELLDEI